MSGPPGERMRVSLCLLTLNERQGCERDVPCLPRDAFDQVYAVDGGSQDGTVEYLLSQGIPVHRQPRPTLNAATAFAFELCTSDALVIFFPKATVPPAEILKFPPLFARGYQLVVASRMLPGASAKEDGRWFRPRKLSGRALGWLAAALWWREGNRITDPLHGVRGMTCDAWRRMQVSDSGVTIDLESVVRAYRLRMPRAEFPVREMPRSYGDSHFGFASTGKQMFRFIARELFTPPPARGPAP